MTGAGQTVIRIFFLCLHFWRKQEQKYHKEGKRNVWKSEQRHLREEGEKMEAKSRSWTSESLQLEDVNFKAGHTDVTSSYFCF